MDNTPKRTNLTKFAFLLSAALPENCTTPVIGLNHQTELSSCFASPSGIISCSSLCIHGSHPGNKAGITAQTQERLASLNMNSPIYTSSDRNSVALTPKTIVMNLIQTMKELMEARLSRTVMQLLKRSGSANFRIMVHLLSPSGNAIRMGTVMTRFEVSEEESQENEENISMIFKGVLDVKIFGQVNTVEICAPVNFVGRFGDGNDEGLLTSVDVKFDCCVLLREMMSKARIVVKKAVAEAAELSVKVLSLSKNGGLANVGLGEHENKLAGDSAALLAAAFKQPNQTFTDNSGLLAAALKLGLQQGVSNQTDVAAPADSHAVLAAALKLGQQGSTTPATTSPTDRNAMLAAALNIGGQQGSNSLTSNDSAGMLAAALKLGKQRDQGTVNSPAFAPRSNQTLTDNSGLLAAALKLGLQQGVSNQTDAAAPAGSHAVLAAALKLGQQGSTTPATTSPTDRNAMLAAALNIGGQQGSNSLTSNDSAGMLAAALKLGKQQDQGTSSAPQADLSSASNATAAPQADLTSASSLAQLSSLLNSTSINQLGVNPASALSFSSFFGNSMGSLRNDTFTNLLKSSNSLNRLGASADWGLNHGGESAAILQRHLQNVSGPGTAAGGGNANATFDFSNAAGAGSAHARNILLGLVGGNLGNLNSMAANISCDSIDAASAAAAGTNRKMPQNFSMLHNTTTSQYDLLRDLLLKKGYEAPPLSSQPVSTRPSAESSTQPQQPQHSPDPTQSKPIGNIHKGLFSWLENDSMILSEDKLKEQDMVFNKKQEESQKAPMPLRLFSSGGDGTTTNNDNLEMMGKLLSGKKRKGGRQGGGGQRKKP